MFALDRYFYSIDTVHIGNLIHILPVLTLLLQRLLKWIFFAFQRFAYRCPIIVVIQLLKWPIHYRRKLYMARCWFNTAICKLIGINFKIYNISIILYCQVIWIKLRSTITIVCLVSLRKLSGQFCIVVKVLELRNAQCTLQLGHWCQYMQWMN
jgi:hypothetical protein